MRHELRTVYFSVRSSRQHIIQDEIAISSVYEDRKQNKRTGRSRLRRTAPRFLPLATFDMRCRSSYVIQTRCIRKIRAIAGCGSRYLTGKSTTLGHIFVCETDILGIEDPSHAWYLAVHCSLFPPQVAGLSA
jgi:hypothetical protein